MTAQRTFSYEACPRCLVWTCSSCGCVRRRSDGSHPQRCPECSGTEGTSIRVHHYDEDTQAVHVMQYEREKTAWNTTPEHIRDIEALVDFLSPAWATYQRVHRQRLKSAPGSKEHRRALLRERDSLLKIEDIVRSWSWGRQPPASEGTS